MHQDFIIIPHMFIGTSSAWTAVHRARSRTEQLLGFVCSRERSQCTDDITDGNVLCRAMSLSWDGKEGPHYGGDI
jgi:hypothetical protein